ncbi:hypothetical protein B0O99DRAFT_693398 [Bisporella sp. PMI_857]|nr:hypothetical protein B0O99DRAFT_693398 [Bisporella sp. PMI_857]
MPSTTALLAHFLVLAAVQGQTVYRHGDGDLFIRDGIVNLQGLTGTVFQVINYMPVCGTLSSSLTRQSDLSDKCTAAMSTFNTTSATAAIYDLSGVASSELPGSGTQLCICGAFGTPTAKAGDPKSNGLLCVWVDEKGYEEEWWSGATDTRVASSFQLSAQGKALPLCSAVDLVSLSAESLATRTAETSSPTSKATSTAGSGKAGSGTTQSSPTSTDPTSSGTASSSSSEKSSQALSNQAIIGVAIAVAVVCISVTAAFIYYRRSRRPSPASILQDNKSSQNLYGQRPNSFDGRSSAWVGVAEWNANVRS